MSGGTSFGEQLVGVFHQGNLGPLLTVIGSIVAGTAAICWFLAGQYRKALDDRLAHAKDERDSAIAKLKVAEESVAKVSAEIIIRGAPEGKAPAVIVDLDHVDGIVGSVSERFSAAQSEVWISGNDCAYLVSSRLSDLEAALRRGVSVRVLCADPKSSAAQMLRLIDPQFDKDGRFEDSMRDIIRRLKSVREEFPNLDMRLLPILPALGFFLVDPDNAHHKNIKVEIYSPRPFAPTSSRPHLIVSEAYPEWQSHFIRQFRNYWNLAHNPTDW